MMIIILLTGSKRTKDMTDKRVGLVIAELSIWRYSAVVSPEPIPMNTISTARDK